MKTLMILGLAAVVSQSGCSTENRMLEPGVDKGREVSPELSGRRRPCHECNSNGDCQHRPAYSNPNPPSGITP